MLFILKSIDKDYCQKISKYMEECDKIVLIQDGVLLLHDRENELIKLFGEKKAEILFLKDDLNMRGLKNNAEAKEITYEAMVELIEKNTVFS